MKQIIFTVSLLFAFFIIDSAYGGDLINNEAMYSKTITVAVSVSGILIDAGTYNISRNMRIIDAIKAANNNKLPDLAKINCRSIKIVSPEFTKNIDLLNFLNTGNLENNPFVTSGMHIHINPAVKCVYISGDLQGIFLGKIPFYEGETASQILSLFTFNETADTNRILVQRVGEKSKELSFSSLNTITLENLDVITVFPIKDRKIVHRVSMKGEVERPGMYSIIHQKTSAKEIIEQAGGTTRFGDVKRAYVIRRAKTLSLPSKELIDGLRSAREEIYFGMNHAVKSNDYAIFPILENVILEDGDEIIVPFIEKNVYVSGDVKNPGPIPYLKGESVGYYIKQAGGYTKQADKINVKIVSNFHDSWKTTDNILAGDIIIIPQAEEGKNFKRWVPVIQVIATSVTAFVALFSIISR
jgi:protein involved in polysaccharide export with SLBB domain